MDSGAVEPERARISALYAKPMPSTRGGALYRAFSYPTKIDPEAIAVFIAVHSHVGATVLDPFGGSGTTGIAARLCSRPTTRMLRLAKQMGVDPQWGPRDAVVYELSPLGALLGQVMAMPPDPEIFRSAADEILSRVEHQNKMAYAAVDPAKGSGVIRYVVWSEIVVTACCGLELTYWSACARRSPAHFEKDFLCPECGAQNHVAALERKLDEHGRRLRVPVHVWGRTDSRTWDRPVTDDDLNRVREFDKEPLRQDEPGAQHLQWGDLHRAGYHSGIHRLVDMYTPRNYRIFRELWTAGCGAPSSVADAIRLWLLSYNASHSTLMTRIVAKKGQADFVLTGAQPGVLYVPALPVEKNIFEGLRRKISTFYKAFSQTSGLRGDVKVVNGSSTELSLDDRTVDYVFTDPPFGGFIPYAEINQINEIWMGKLTNRDSEAIISDSQGKGVEAYADLMASVFTEVSRVMKTSARATVVFHASTAPVWNALAHALDSAGLSIDDTSMWSKTQASFKQVVSENTVRYDALFLLSKMTKAPEQDNGGQPDFADIDSATPYPAYVAHMLKNGIPAKWSISEYSARVK